MNKQDDYLLNRYECQICERKIKAKQGLIAHHGYYLTHQFDDWGSLRSPSCAGARELPYEKSCDLIPPYIVSSKEYLERLENLLTKYKNTPPKTMTQKHEKTYFSEAREEVHERPEGFTYELGMDIHHYWAYQVTYPNYYRRTIGNLEREIKQTKEDIERLTSRVENWSLK